VLPIPDPDGIKYIRDQMHLCYRYLILMGSNTFVPDGL
jgi:hypothetical protein